MLRAAQARAALGTRDLPQHRRLRGVAEDPPRENPARAGHRDGEGLGPAWTRRRRLSDRAQVVVHAAQRPGAEVRGLQLRRERARDLPRPRHTALQPPRADRGHGHRRLRDGRHGRLQLRARRVHGGADPALRGGARRSLCRGAARQEPARLWGRFRPLHVHGRRRLYLRRGNGAPRVARGQAGQAALQAAVPGQFRALRQAHHDQQRAELRLGADHPAQGGRRTRAAR